MQHDDDVRAPLLCSLQDEVEDDDTLGGKITKTACYIDETKFTLAYGRIQYFHGSTWQPVFFAIRLFSDGVHFDIHEHVSDWNPQVWLKGNPTAHLSVDKILLGTNSACPSLPQDGLAPACCSRRGDPGGWVVGETENTSRRKRRCCIFVKDKVHHIMCRTEHEARLINLLGATMNVKHNQSDEEQAAAVASMLNAINHLTENLVPSKECVSFISRHGSRTGTVIPTKMKHDGRPVFTEKASFPNYIYFDKKKKQWAVGGGTSLSCCPCCCTPKFHPTSFTRPTMVVAEDASTPLEFSTVGWDPDQVVSKQPRSLRHKSSRSLINKTIDIQRHSFQPSKEDFFSGSTMNWQTPGGHASTLQQHASSSSSGQQQPQGAGTTGCSQLCTCLCTLVLAPLCFPVFMLRACQGTTKQGQESERQERHRHDATSNDAYYEFFLHGNLMVKGSEILSKVKFMCDNPHIAHSLCVRASPDMDTLLERLLQKLSWREPPRVEPLTSSILEVVESIRQHIVFSREHKRLQKKVLTVDDSERLEAERFKRCHAYTEETIASWLETMQEHLRRDILPVIVDTLHKVLVTGELWGSSSLAFQCIKEPDECECYYPPYFFDHRSEKNGWFNCTSEVIDERPVYVNHVTRRRLYWSAARNRWEIVIKPRRKKQRATGTLNQGANGSSQQASALGAYTDKDSSDEDNLLDEGEEEYQGGAGRAPNGHRGGSAHTKEGQRFETFADHDEEQYPHGVLEAYSNTDCATPDAAVAWRAYGVTAYGSAQFMEMKGVSIVQPPSGMKQAHLLQTLKVACELAETVGLKPETRSDLVAQLNDLLANAVSRARVGGTPDALYWLLRLCASLCRQPVSSLSVYDIALQCVRTNMFDLLVKGFHCTAQMRIDALCEELRLAPSKDEGSYAMILFFEAIADARNLLFKLTRRLRAKGHLPRNFHGTVGNASADDVEQELTQALERLDEQMADYTAVPMMSLFLDSFGKLEDVLQQKDSDDTTRAECDPRDAARFGSKSAGKPKDKNARTGKSSNSSGDGHDEVPEDVEDAGNAHSAHTGNPTDDHGSSQSILTSSWDVFAGIFGTTTKAAGLLHRVSKAVSNLARSRRSLARLVRKLPHALPELMIIVEQAVSGMSELHDATSKLDLSMWVAQEIETQLHEVISHVVDLLANMTEQAVYRSEQRRLNVNAMLAKIEQAMRGVRLTAEEEEFVNTQLVSSAIFQANPIPVLVSLMHGGKRKRQRGEDHGSGFRSTVLLSTQLTWFTAALRALGNLAKSKREHRLRIISEGLVPTLLDFLIVGNLKLRHSATRCLNETLKFTPESVDAFLEGGGHLSVLRLISEATNPQISTADQKLEETLCSVLAAIASVPSGSSALLAEPEFVALIAKVVAEQHALFCSNGAGLRGLRPHMLTQLNLLFLVMTRLHMPEALIGFRHTIAKLQGPLDDNRQVLEFEKEINRKMQGRDAPTQSRIVKENRTIVRQEPGQSDGTPEHDSDMDLLQTGKLLTADGRPLSSMETFVYQLTTLPRVCSEPPPKEDMAAHKYHCFVSYSWDNKKVMRRIADFLTSKGFKVWLDIDKLKKHSTITKGMARGIHNSAVVILDYSPNYLESYNCLAELNHAFSLKKQFVVVKTTDRSPPKDSELEMVKGMHLFYNFAGATSTEDLNAKQADVVEAIEACLATVKRGLPPMSAPDKTYDVVEAIRREQSTSELLSTEEAGRKPRKPPARGVHRRGRLNTQGDPKRERMRQK